VVEVDPFVDDGDPHPFALPALRPRERRTDVFARRAAALARVRQVPL
jgi:hypothetical protein